MQARSQIMDKQELPQPAFEKDCSGVLRADTIPSLYRMLPLSYLGRREEDKESYSLTHRA